MYTNPAFFFWLRAETTQQRGNDLRCCMLLSVPDLCYLPFCFFCTLGALQHYHRKPGRKAGLYDNIELQVSLTGFHWDPHAERDLLTHSRSLVFSQRDAVARVTLYAPGSHGRDAQLWASLTMHAPSHAGSAVHVCR